MGKLETYSYLLCTVRYLKIVVHENMVRTSLNVVRSYQDSIGVKTVVLMLGKEWFILGSQGIKSLKSFGIKRR